MSIPKQISMYVWLPIFLTFFKSGKIITFSHLKTTNLNDNVKDYFVREKVNKMV